MFYKIHLMVASSLLKTRKLGIKLLPLANEVWGKVIFLHLSVILFTGRGVPGQVHPPARYKVHPPGDTGNKWAVRILLECILVWKCNTGMNVFVNFLEMHSLRLPSAQASSGRFFSSVTVGTIIIFR